MKYKEFQYLDKGIEIKVTVDNLDILEFKPDEFSTLLFKECRGSSSIADKLLALECLVRKLEKTGRVKGEISIYNKIARY